MYTFTKEQYDTLISQAKDIMGHIADNESTKEIMAQIYVKNLEDKTMRQGEVMADAIISQVKKFDSDYQDAKENLNGFIRKFQTRVDESKTCVERCNYWQKLAAAVSAANLAMNDGEADREKILQEIEALSVSEQEATPELENELREKAAEALRNSGVMLSGLMEQSKEIEKLSQADEAAGMLIDLGNRELGYREIVAMLAYTKIKNGEFDSMPADMTAAQVAATVCAAIEQSRIQEAVGSGTMGVALASNLLLVLGAVVLVEFAFLAANVGMLFAGAMFGTILFIPACLMIIAGTLHLFKAAIDAWEKDSQWIVKKTVVAAKAVAKGAAALWTFARDKVWPMLVEIGKTVLSSIRKFVETHKKESVPTTVRQPAN